MHLAGSPGSYFAYLKDCLEEWSKKTDFNSRGRELRAWSTIMGKEFHRRDVAISNTDFFRAQLTVLYFV